MMQRRGISEIYATIMMFSIGLGIAGVLMINSSNQLNTQQQSAYQMLDSAQKKMSESISFVSGSDTDTGSSIEVVNYGLTSIQLDSVMVDTVQKTYSMTLINGTATSVLPVKEPVVISTNIQGSKMQLGTANGYIFEFPLQ